MEKSQHRPTDFNEDTANESASVALVGCVAQWRNAGLSPGNFPCPALDLQLIGDQLYG